MGKLPGRWGLKFDECILLQKGKTFTKRGTLGMILNFI